MRTVFATAVTTLVLMLTSAPALANATIGPHFNPDAVLDPSQVTDTRPQACTK